MPCRACSAPEADDLCPHCAVAGPLLHNDPAERIAALRRLEADARPVVLTAALRGGPLWADLRAEGEDLGEVLIDWLLDNGLNVGFTRWVAEDSRYGWQARPVLAHHDPDRAIVRAPVWLDRVAEERASHRFGSGLPTRRHVEALLGRLGRCGYSWTEVRKLLGLGLLSGLVLRSAYKAGTSPSGTDEWLPQRPTPQRRRWPVPRIEADSVVCCSVCGEPVGSTHCAWCGTDPEKEPPSLAPLVSFLDGRTPCSTCGWDIHRSMAPSRCPECGAPP